MAQQIITVPDGPVTASQMRAFHIRRFHAALVLMHPDDARPQVDIDAIVEPLNTWTEDDRFPPIHLALWAYRPHLETISAGPVKTYLNDPYSELVAEASADAPTPGATMRMHLYRGIFTDTRFTCRVKDRPEAISPRALAVWALMRTRFDHARWERARTMHRVVSAARASQIAPQVRSLLATVADEWFTGEVDETLRRVIRKG